MSDGVASLLLPLVIVLALALQLLRARRAEARAAEIAHAAPGVARGELTLAPPWTPPTFLVRPPLTPAAQPRPQTGHRDARGPRAPRDARDRHALPESERREARRSARSLRGAIVMAEVLGPPRALRAGRSGGPFF